MQLAAFGTAATEAGFSPPENLELGALLPAGWEEKAGPVGKAFSGLLRNPYFSAGAGLWLVTAAGFAGRSLTSAFRELMRRQFLVSIEVVNTDSSFTSLERWIATQPGFKARQMTVSTQVFYSTGEADKLYFSPAPGHRHYFFYKSRPIWMNRVRNTKRDMDGEIFESMKFSTYGMNTAIFEDMMRSAKQAEEDKKKKYTEVFTNNGSYWASQRQRTIRPLPSVILPEGVSDKILEDVTKFRSSVDYYKQLGVPYRRGYLLHGPPGCGKTSFVMALAGQLNTSISLLSMSAKSINDEVLMDLLNKAKEGTIILMEDIDRAFAANSAVTMSGLLNALDGVGAQEGNIVFMTTNHVEKLDAALIRPGRVDLKVEIGLLDSYQVRQMFIKFFPDATEDQQDRIVAAVNTKTMSAAQLQSHLFIQRDDAESAISQLPQFLSQLDEFEKELEERRLATKKALFGGKNKANGDDDEDD